MSRETPATLEPSEPTPTQSSDGLMILGAGRLTPQDIALEAAERSEATGLGSAGIAVWEKVD
jgi:hypothetical protein